MKRLKVISCGIFAREFYYAAGRSPEVIDIEFIAQGMHDDTEQLNRAIQKKIDQTEMSPRNYKAVLLGFGLCGNSTAGITARSLPVVIPRAHDCCAIFLGSKKKFIKHFKKRPSAEWRSAGYLERGTEKERGRREHLLFLGLNRSYGELVERYGEDNARYVMEKMRPQKEDRLIYIEIPEFRFLGYAEKMEEKAESEGREFEKISGGLYIIEALLNCAWSEEEFLVVEPGSTIEPVYDWQKVMRC